MFCRTFYRNVHWIVGAAAAIACRRSPCRTRVFLETSGQVVAGGWLSPPPRGTGAVGETKYKIIHDDCISGCVRGVGVVVRGPGALGAARRVRPCGQPTRSHIRRQGIRAPGRGQCRGRTHYRRCGRRSRRTHCRRRHSQRCRKDRRRRTGPGPGRPGAAAVR